MERAEFMHWLTGIARLSPAQRREALEALSKGKDVGEGVGSGSGGSVGTGRESGASPAKAGRGKEPPERRVPSRLDRDVERVEVHMEDD